MYLRQGRPLIPQSCFDAPLYSTARSRFFQHGLGCAAGVRDVRTAGPPKANTRQRSRASLGYAALIARLKRIEDQVDGNGTRLKAAAAENGRGVEVLENAASFVDLKQADRHDLRAPDGDYGTAVAATVRGLNHESEASKDVASIHGPDQADRDHLDSRDDGAALMQSQGQPARDLANAGDPQQTVVFRDDAENPSAVSTHPDTLEETASGREYRDSQNSHHCRDPSDSSFTSPRSSRSRVLFPTQLSPDVGEDSTIFNPVSRGMAAVQRTNRKYIEHQMRGSLRSEDVYQAGLSFFSGLSELLEKSSDGHEILEFLQSSKFLRERVESTMLGEEEQNLLRATIERIATFEFGQLLTPTARDLNVRRGSTAWLLGTFKSSEILEPTHWATALSRSTAALSTSYELPLSPNHGSAKLSPERQTLDYRQVHGIGLQLDSLLRLWRTFYASGTEVSDGSTGAFALSARKAWRESDEVLDTTPKELDQSFHDVLLAPLKAINSGMDNAARVEVASASLLTSHMIIDALKIAIAPCGGFSKDPSVEKSASVKRRRDTSIDRAILWEAKRRKDDLYFLKWIGGSLAAVQPNRILLRLTLAKLGVSLETAAQVQQVLPKLKDFALLKEPVQQAHVTGKKADREARVLPYSRFDGILPFLAKHSGSHSPTELLAWLGQVEKYLKRSYFQDELVHGIISMIADRKTSDGSMTPGNDHSTMTGQMRQTISLCLRLLFNNGDVDGMEMLWDVVMPDGTKRGCKNTVWWYYRLLLWWKYDPLKAMDIFDTNLEFFDENLTKPQFVKIANHVLYWASASHPDIVNLVHGFLIHRQLEHNRTTCLALVRFAIRFNSLEPIDVYLAKYRQLSRDDGLLRREASFLLLRRLDHVQSLPKLSIAQGRRHIGSLVLLLITFRSRHLNDMASRSVLLLDRGAHKLFGHNNNLKRRLHGTIRVAVDVCLDLKQALALRRGREHSDEVIDTAINGYVQQLVKYVQQSNVRNQIRKNYDYHSTVPSTNTASLGATNETLSGQSPHWGKIGAMLVCQGDAIREMAAMCTQLESERLLYATSSRESEMESPPTIRYYKTEAIATARTDHSAGSDIEQTQIEEEEDISPEDREEPGDAHGRAAR